MRLWRFWLEKLLLKCILGEIKFDNIIFNPTMLMLLFENKNPLLFIGFSVAFEEDLVRVVLQQFVNFLKKFDKLKGGKKYLDLWPYARLADLFYLVNSIFPSEAGVMTYDMVCLRIGRYPDFLK
uniref:Uncharacterized protein n=1 Tax=Meloidogyne enterolobii TaxID=390850 RepID=A0A6V7TJL0_MELEN|nr:unnamed protein product [Meloidogyne enterolobii]